MINWVKKTQLEICSLIDSRMNENLLAINQTHDILEADKFHSEFRILIAPKTRFLLYRTD